MSSSNKSEPINWFTISRLNEIGITSIKLSYIDPSPEMLCSIMTMCMDHMRGIGFIFKGDPEYRVKYNSKGRMIEFGVKYNRIKNEK